MVAFLEKQTGRGGVIAFASFVIVMLIARISGLLAPVTAEADESHAPVADRNQLDNILPAQPSEHERDWVFAGSSDYGQGGYYGQGYYQTTYYGQGTYYSQAGYYSQSYYQGLYYNQAGYYGQAAYYGQGYYQSAYTTPVGVYSFEYEPNGYCVRVTIRKSENHPRTTIESDGYNVPCDEVSISARALQRTVVLQY